jgi:hypothetical protein
MYNYPSTNIKTSQSLTDFVPQPQDPFSSLLPKLANKANK